MTIEELKEMEAYVRVKLLSGRQNGKTLAKKITTLINAEIARQSITDLDVRLAIEYFKEDQDGWWGSKTWDLYSLAITALQQMRGENNG